jgi:uncharacterized protein YqjF (DUF2071 family)
LLFAHWPVPTEKLRPLVPPELELEELEGTSWVGLVPFRMTGVMRRPLPDIPWISAFPELNVRLYVVHGGKPGVWFLSLDAANPLAVWAARKFFHLPYFHARMQLDERDGRIHYSASRKNRPSTLRASYRAVSDVYESKRDSLEHSLTERYCLYARAPDGSIWRNDVHHVPWPLQRAEVEIEENSYLTAHGLSVAGPPALLHFARRLDVVVWSAERVA